MGFNRQIQLKSESHQIWSCSNIFERIIYLSSYSLPMIRKIFRRLFLPGLITLLIIVLVVSICYSTVAKAASGKIFDSVSDVPKRKVAVVMGCSRILANGRNNVYFSYRINAAARLFRERKCQYIIVSGDNSHEGYDEPTDMREALIAKGVPKNRIYRDYAGFRTLDSVVRAKEIFGQDDFIVVSQKFHNERAIYIAQKHGFKNVVGYTASRVSTFGGFRTRMREYLARVKTVLDVTALKTKPKFLGEKVELGWPVT